MKNDGVPDELANDKGQIIGGTTTNLSTDQPDVFSGEALCTCGCLSCIVDLREHTDTRNICTNCGAQYLMDICIECGQDCRPANPELMWGICADCYG